MSLALSVFCPAKVNLGLRVTGRRPDGYHLLDTLFCAIDLGDELTLETGAETASLDVVDEAGTGLDVPNDGSNLVLKAIERFRTHSRVAGAKGPLGGKLHLTKRVPSGGGLGGGSADAAAAFRLMAELRGIDIDPELRELALGLGADVPFLIDAGLMRARGVGETLENVEFAEELHFVLAVPPFGTSTASVFRRFAQAHAHSTESDAVPPGARGSLGAPLAPAEAIHPAGLPFDLGNDLEAPARAIEPRLDRLIDELREAVPDLALSGSGSTLFAVRPTRSGADQLQEEVEARLASLDTGRLGGPVKVLRARGPISAPEIHRVEVQSARTEDG